MKFSKFGAVEFKFLLMQMSIFVKRLGQGYKKKT